MKYHFSGPSKELTQAEIDSVRAMTSTGAYLCVEEQEKGSLEAAKLADLLVLSADPLSAEEDALKDIRVDLAMVGGQVVHTSDPSLAEPDLPIPGTQSA